MQDKKIIGMILELLLASTSSAASNNFDIYFSSLYQDFQKDPSADFFDQSTLSLLPNHIPEPVFAESSSIASSAAPAAPSAATYLPSVETLIQKQKKCLQCPSCDKTFVQKGDLARHIRSVHEKIKDHTCPTCNQTFGRKGTLTTHIRSVHDKIKDHICSTCNKTFGQKHHLTRHIKIVHKKKKNHVCSICDQAFGQKGALTQHEQTQKHALALTSLTLPLNPNLFGDLDAG